MKKREISNSDKEKIIGLISAVLPDAKIYLYGSFARSNQRSWSDIDLALELNGKIDFVRIGEIKDVLNASSVPFKFDVVDINAVSKDIREQILKDRVIWKN